MENNVGRKTVGQILTRSVGIMFEDPSLVDQERTEAGKRSQQLPSQRLRTSLMRIFLNLKVLLIVVAPS